ncbi:hypothetical protein THTE_2441 [Thermogutta terrifontis]|uniref:Uncharacterized protein n=1 Tax=Thermogutta terrifontis TaxID=1331910 RepID=A0A286RGF5_9BACT|nr:hypothetical protein THTE_2441 [Thermogutta terrifontis]
MPSGLTDELRLLKVRLWGDASIRLWLTGSLENKESDRWVECR